MGVILIDDRSGSKELFPSLKKIGLPVELARLPTGDLAFTGRGEKGVAIDIGIEFKTITELVQALRTQRLQGHQLLEMRGTPPVFDFCWLLVEGEPLYTAQGMLVRRNGKRSVKPLGMTITELYKRMTVLHLCGGLNPVFTNTRQDTVKWIEAMYHALTDVDLDQHKSHLAIYTPPSLVPPTQFERTISTLPGIGRRVAKAAEKRFGTITVALAASVEQWAAVETVDEKGKARKLGSSAAMKIKEAIR